MTRRINLFPNPGFDPDGFAAGVWDGDHSAEMPGDGTFVPDPGHEYSTLKLPELREGVEYVISLKAVGTTVVTCWLNDAQQWFTKGDDDVFTLRYTVAAGESQASNRFVFTRGVVYSEPQIEPASTSDPAVAGGGLRFFAWDTMPRA